MGIALALLLAWLVGRTALVPLNELTSSVEEVAETTDVSERLDAGGVRRAGAAPPRLQPPARRRWNAPGSPSASWSSTPATSCARHSPACGPTSRWCAAWTSCLPRIARCWSTIVLTQMEELTNLVGDLSELARGEQRRVAPAPLRLDQLVEDAVAVATTHGRSRGRAVHAVGRADLGRGAARAHRPGGREPARQCPQVEPRRRRGGGALRRRRGHRAGPRSGHRPRRPAARLRPFLPGSGAPGPCRGRGWVWPSSPRWPRPKAGRQRPGTPSGGGARCAWPCHWYRPQPTGRAIRTTTKPERGRIGDRPTVRAAFFVSS